MIKNLNPECIWRNFHALTQIPRPSGHLEKVQQFLLDFAKEAGVEAFKDPAGNIVMRKPATPGLENKKGIILQAHMDMVPQKSPDSTHNFETDPIEAYLDEEGWVRAKGTTLGADDGIGCAIELAILESNEIEHGPLECVFTRDEETQLTGASGMKAGFMTGDMLINLDSEDEGQIFVSCAGGRSTTATFNFKREEAPTGYFFIEGSIKGLTGGHSGDDIEKKRANAIKILARYIYKEVEKMDVRLISFNSGKMHNAIPRDGRFVIAVPSDRKEEARVDWNIFASEVEEEFHVSDTQMVWNMQSTEAQPVIEKNVADRFVRALQAVDNGVFAMCQDKALENMVETSSNIASIITEEDKITCVASQRSNVMSNLDNQCNTVKALFELAGAEVVQNDGYPAWKMNPNSELTALVVESYKKLFGKEPIVRGIHAGLECGLFSEKYPSLDMVSFGPTLRFVHTPEERIHIPTVEMVWNHLLDVLKNIPSK